MITIIGKSSRQRRIYVPDSDIRELVVAYRHARVARGHAVESFLVNSRGGSASPQYIRRLIRQLPSLRRYLPARRRRRYPLRQRLLGHRASSRQKSTHTSPMLHCGLGPSNGTLVNHSFGVADKAPLSASPTRSAPESVRNQQIASLEDDRLQPRKSLWTPPQAGRRSLTGQLRLYRRSPERQLQDLHKNCAHQYWLNQRSKSCYRQGSSWHASYA